MNLFPVRVTLPDGRVVANTRVVARDGTTTIYVWDRRARSGVPLLEVLGEPLLAVTGRGTPRPDRYTLDTPDGQAVLRSTCLPCSSNPMKRWQPEYPVRLRATP